MPSQGYERVRQTCSHRTDGIGHRQDRYTDSRQQVGAEDPDVPNSYSSGPVPNSPPPSFHSRSSSPQSPSTRRTSHHEVDRTLAETFDAMDGESDDEETDDRARLVRNATSSADDSPQPVGSLRRANTELPSFVNPSESSRPNTSNNNMGGDRRFVPSNDGVFANINAKPQAGDTTEELPPSYEQAAADATPPYWETTLLAPGMLSDEVYIDGLPVGSFFSFAWNGIIAMAFPLVGFLLTYLLHTTHAARNGSRAGLGVTLVNYGFTMRSAGNGAGPGGAPDGAAGGEGMARPANPDEHNFDPSKDAIFDDGPGGDPTAAAGPDGSHSGDWLAYVLMIAGWIILIKAVTDYIRARRHEQLVLQSPERNLPLPVVAEHDPAESAV